MLAYIRRFAKTWPARALFGALVLAFGLWGVAGRLTGANSDTVVAQVGPRRIEAAEVQRAFARQLAQLTHQKGAGFQPDAKQRSEIAHQAVQQSVIQALIEAEMTKLGLVVPDGSVRAATFALPAFKGINGQFDRERFRAVLARNGMDEPGFIELMRGDLARQQLTTALSAGFAASDQMVQAVFAYARESRIAQAVTLPFASAGDIPAPAEAQLRRYWANNPGLYATPEYRRIKAVVLTAQTLAGEMAVTDQEIRQFYDLAKSTYDRPEKRSVQIVSASDQATASRLAAAWQGGLDWPAIQAQTKSANATAVNIPGATKAELPDATLARAAFAAAPDAVIGPSKGDFGWYVLKVTSVTPASVQTLAQAHDEIRQKIGVLKANDAMDDRVNKLEDALAGGGGLDSLPQGLGVAAVEGTLDAQGNTPDHIPAPLPAYPALRAAIIAAAFKAKPGDEPQVQQLPPDQENTAGGTFALQMEAIIKPGLLGYDAVADRVRQDWTRDQRRHAEEVKAASLLAQVHAGHALTAVAAAQGYAVQTLPPIPRPVGDPPPPAGVPAALVAPLFTMQPGEATMIETADGFVVAALDRISTPPMASDPVGVAPMRADLSDSLGADASNLFLEALEHRFKVTLNEPLIQQIAKP